MAISDIICTGSHTPADSKPDTNAQKVVPVLMRDLNEEEKPREKAGRLGLDSLTDVELLALLLGSGMSGKSVLDLAREILQDNDNKLSRLSRMSIAELKKKYKGVGTAKATLLSAAMTFGARVQKSLTLVEEHYEEFWVLHLNRANRVLFKERVSKGGMACTAVDIKLIAKSAIDHLSSGIILLHNHPSGTMQPSGQDDSLTQRIVEICKIIDVPVHDHLIIGPTGYYSYRDSGKL